MEVTKGILYGVGVGPGAPELLTLKAVRTLEKCPVIAAPRTKSGETLALDIVRQAVDLEGKTIEALHFTMARDKSQWREAHRQAADAIEAHLAAGRDVAMPNLGDVSLYSTFGYLKTLLEERGYACVMIPGVPSFCAAAARVGASLAGGDAPLHIIPLGGGETEKLLSLPGAKVLMKAGRELPYAAEILARTGQLERAVLVEDCGLPGERIWDNWTELPETVSYFATMIVKEE